jgi:hypothetical protein
MEKAKMVVQCNNLNNSATTCPFHPVRSALERSTPVDEIHVCGMLNRSNYSGLRRLHSPFIEQIVTEPKLTPFHENPMISLQ